MAETRAADGPSQYAELRWTGPLDLQAVIPGREGVCWVAGDDAAGWRAVLEGAWGRDGELRPGVRWAVTRLGGVLLMEGQTRCLDAAVLDAERYIEELLEAAPAERLLSQVLGEGGG